MARKLRTDEVKITITPEEEEINPSDDCSDDSMFVHAVEDMVDQYGLWGWCSVHVQVKFGPLEGNSYLGCCSFRDEEDFKTGGYYEQMVEDAMTDLQSQLDSLLDLIGI